MIEYEKEADGKFIADIPDLPGVMVYGATKKEAKRRVLALALRVLSDDEDEDLEEFEDDDLETEALHGSAPSETPEPMAAELTLDILTAVTKLTVLLSEAEPAEFRALKPRLTALRAAVEALPTKATEKEPMGFKPKAKKSAKKVKKGGKR